MSGGIKLRLAAFVLAIVSMVGLIVWAAQSAWRRSGELRENLTAVQWKSFQIADHLQQTILELNNSVMRYGAYHDTNDWRHFTGTSKELDDWIDPERPNLNTEKEVHFLDL